MKYTINKISCSLTLCALLISGGAQAHDQEWENGLRLETDHRLSLGALMRVQSRDQSLIGIGNGGTARSTNGDDGNLTFDRGDVVASALKFASDISLSRGDSGLFVRASVLFDETINNHGFFDVNDYGAGKEAPLSEYTDKNRKLHGHNGSYVEVLDAYLFTSVRLFERDIALRAGRQIINWGESTLILNGINSTLAVDANRLRVPGFELNEVLQPAEQLWLAAQIVGNLNVEAFYQLRWRNTEPDAAGSYFSAQDFVGIGATRANIGFGAPNENTPGTTVPRAADRTPRNSGQFGVKLDYTFDALDSLNLALYVSRYHSRLPVFSGTSKPTFGSPSTAANYFTEYPENIQLYGLSFNTALPFGGLAIQGEYSYKKDQPLQIDDVELLLTGLGVPSQLSPALGASLGGKYIRGWRRHNVQQADIGLTKIFSPSDWFGYDQMVGLFEAAVMDADLPPSSTLRYEAPATYTPGDCTLSAAACTGGVTQNTTPYASPRSWGYRLLARFDYNNAFGSAIGLQPTVTFAHDVNGTSPAPLTNFVEGRKQVSLVLGFRYLENWNGEIGYVNFLGAGSRNLINDRDYVDMSVKYSF